MLFDFKVPATFALFATRSGGRTRFRFDFRLQKGKKRRKKKKKEEEEEKAEE
jgi:hypothetical protein